MIDPLIAARAIHLVATVVAAGVIAFEVLILRGVLTTDKAAKTYTATLDRWVWSCLAIAVVSGLAWALLVAMQISDGSAIQASADGTLTTLMTETRFGQVWIWRGILAAIVALALWSRQRMVALVAATAMLALVAFVGHSAARLGAIGWLQTLADVGHLLAAGLWLGSLPALALLLAMRVPAKTCAAVTRRFSGFGIVAVVTLLVTGAFNTWLLTDSIAGLLETSYGRLLLLKIAVFAVMLALAAVNRLYWTPRLPAPRAIGAIRRHSIVEAGLGCAVLIIVAWLGTLPPPLHSHVHIAESPADGAFVHIHDVKAMAEVTILPGWPGPSEVWIRLMKEDFNPLPAQTVTLALSQAGQRTVTVDARNGAPGLWRTPDIVLPTAGGWLAVVTVITGKGEPIVLDGPIVIDPGSTAKSAKSE